jgi:tetratricopeptide (TPR) repeat protein
MKKVLLGVAVLATGLFVFTSCGSDEKSESTDSTTSTEAALAQTEIPAEIQQLKDVDPSAYEEALKMYEEAMKQSAEDYKQAMDNAKDAYDEAVNDVYKDEDVQKALNASQKALDAAKQLSDSYDADDYEAAMKAAQSAADAYSAAASMYY